MINIVVSEQMLYHHRSDGIDVAYPVSTATKGVGNLQGSFQTPLGWHKVCLCVGEGAPEGTVFVGRQAVGLYNQATKHERDDWILSRILWLEGAEAGVNKFGDVDTKQRYIYIHGTNEEDKIGRPASHGCIRMRQADVVDLFAHVVVGEPVLIQI